MGRACAGPPAALARRCCPPPLAPPVPPANPRPTAHPSLCRVRALQFLCCIRVDREDIQVGCRWMA